MNILYILKQKNADDTVSRIIEEQKKTNQVTIINISESKNYDEIVDKITSSDKVISW